MAQLLLWTINLSFLYSYTANGFFLNISESLNDTAAVRTSTTVSLTTILEYQRRLHWADSAFNFIKSLNCSQVYFTSQRECNHLLNVRKRNVAVYAAQAANMTEGHFIAMLPDGGLSRAGAHHAILALDPHPDANFGHLVLVFFIDKTHSQLSCERHHGIYVGNSECMKLAEKHRCRNWQRRFADSSYSMTSRQIRKMVRRCEVNFLPLVHSENDKEPEIIEGISQGYEQSLLCREDLIEYSLCPSLRPANETLNLVCNPIRDNTRRCETTHETVGMSCRMFESCDKAVLISGGWNRQTSVNRHSENIVNIYHLLRRNGFEQKSVKIFFANGMHREEDGADSLDTEIFPAAMKYSMRLHIRNICHKPHCVDSLILYLNSPSKTDGTMLLWDVNKNGLLEDEEQYSVEELLGDLNGCRATSVQIIADQSFSGELSKAIRKSTSHPNVVVYASGKENEYSYLSTFTDHWTRLDHSRTCTEEAFQQIKSTMLLSTPDIGLNMNRNSGVSNSFTLFGAPCNVEPPFSDDELREWYRGCQDIPLDVWLRTYIAGGNSALLQSAESDDVQSNYLASRESSSSANIQIVDEVSSGDDSHEISSNSLPTT
ncbi:uncharacterized protein [Watersipora subatra]|uniref:uncharacterized protein isoform X2 n=1 Tax=Watersipora subatra TaxID=2589382 RepID=UPI00355BC381